MRLNISARWKCWKWPAKLPSSTKSAARSINSGVVETPPNPLLHVPATATPLIRSKNSPATLTGDDLRHRVNSFAVGKHLPLPFVFAQRRQFNFGFPGISPMHGLAVVTEGFLRK